MLDSECYYSGKGKNSCNKSSSMTGETKAALTKSKEKTGVTHWVLLTHTRCVCVRVCVGGCAHVCLCVHLLEGMRREAVSVIVAMLQQSVCESRSITPLTGAGSVLKILY